MTAARTDGGPTRKPGDKIARKLELVRRLAEGGMGELWVARNLATHAEVAIKVLLPRRMSAAGDDHAAERFRHEAEVGAKLAHRNVTRVFDLLVDDDGALVLVMELLHGHTLEAAYKEKGTLSAAEAIELIVPILGALQHAHDRGVVHRDVKPSNIFLDVDPDGHTTPKLLDFGIAKTRESTALTHTGEALGSPRYMSPEQVRANKQLDGRSDLFSIGVVLYEIITGENPFGASSPTAALAQVLELEVDPDPRIEPRLWLEIQRALSKQPYERHASAKELADALCRAVGVTAPESLRRPGAGGVAISASPPSVRRQEASSTPRTEPRSDALATSRAVTRTAVMPSAPDRAARGSWPPAPAALSAAPSPGRSAKRTRAMGWIAAAIAVVLVLAFIVFGRSTTADTASTPTAQVDAGAAGAAASSSASASGDDAPSSIGDLDTPPTTTPRATRGIPRRRPVVLPGTSHPAPGGAAAGKAPPAAPAATPSIARTPGF